MKAVFLKHLLNIPVFQRDYGWQGCYFPSLNNEAYLFVVQIEVECIFCCFAQKLMEILHFAISR